MSQRWINNEESGLSIRNKLNSNFLELWNSASVSVTTASYAAYTNKINYFTGSQYFAGPIEASITAPSSSVTPSASGSVAFQLDEVNDKLMFQIQYSDGTLHSASADI